MLQGQGWEISLSHIRHGLEKAQWEGRFSVLCSNPQVVMDGAHNEDAEKKLRDYASGEEFLKVGSRFVQGSIELAITPCYEYSVHTNGAKSKGQL